jgi:hypothetical protein
MRPFILFFFYSFWGEGGVLIAPIYTVLPPRRKLGTVSVMRNLTTHYP